jgi:hypothetical protein
MTHLTDEPVDRHEHIRQVEPAQEEHIVHEVHTYQTPPVAHTHVEPVVEQHVVTDATPVYREEIVYDTALEDRQILNKASQFIWLIAGLVEALIAIRVFLKLIAANPASAFANFIYGLTDLLLWPFFGLTGTPSANGAVLEIPSIIAMVVYALLFWLMVKLLWLFFERPSARSVKTYERV